MSFFAGTKARSKIEATPKAQDCDFEHDPPFDWVLVLILLVSCVSVALSLFFM